MKRSFLTLFSIVLVIAGTSFFGGVGTASAAIETFDFIFSPVPAVEGYDYTATATGFITVDDSYLDNPSPSGGIQTYFLSLPNPAILDLSVTISGDSHGLGNGTFGLNDFADVLWDTGGVKLDFSQQLVGQATNASAGYGDPWGTPSGHGGEFGFDAKDTTLGGVTVWYFSQLTYYTDGESRVSGDGMVLTSMVPRTSVPEPTSILLLGLGLIGLAGVRRKFKQ